MNRYIKLPSFFYEDNLLYFNDLYINPFQIESFIENDITYTDEDGMHVEKSCVSITTKTGQEHGIMMSVDEFHELIN